MHGATHMITGATLGLAIASARGDEPLIIAACTLAGGVAGLAPDWLQFNIPGASKQIKGAFGHRGFSHWIWAALAVAWGLHTLGAPVVIALAALAGWLSHIALDALADGVPAFWPFGRLTLGHVKTGGNIDKLTGCAALVAFVALLVVQIASVI